MPAAQGSQSRVASTSKLTRVPSQYDMLSVICGQLFSTDTVYLAATCHEIRKYITSSKTLYDGFMANACCDGRGVLARAKYFGLWEGDLIETKAHYRGAEARVCSDCPAMVCNVPRLLLYAVPDYYDDDSDDGEIRSVGGAVMKYYWDQFEEVDCAHAQLERNPLGPDQIEHSIAGFLVNEAYNEAFYASCQPLMLPSFKKPESIVACTIYDHVVRPWRCIACTVDKEHEARFHQGKVVRRTYDPENELNSRHWRSDGWIVASRTSRLCQ